MRIAWRTRSRTSSGCARRCSSRSGGTIRAARRAAWTATRRGCASSGSRSASTATAPGPARWSWPSRSSSWPCSWTSRRRTSERPLPSPEPGTPLDQVDTPALVIDLDALERNLDRMAAFTARTGKRVRPHAKTHKSPVIGRMQLERGAIGLCCAKLGEAQVLAGAAVGPLLVTTEIAGEPKVARLVALRRRAEIMVALDDMDVARALSDAMRAAGLRLDVLVDVNVGQDRTGVQPEDAGALAACVAALGGLRLRGIQAYEGHLQHVYLEAERRVKWRQCADRI